jgi:hypothetical protein
MLLDFNKESFRAVNENLYQQTEGKEFNPKYFRITYQIPIKVYYDPK